MSNLFLPNISSILDEFKSIPNLSSKGSKSTLEKNVLNV